MNTRPNSGRTRSKNSTKYPDNQQQISLKDRITLVVSKVGSINYKQCCSTPNVREKVNSRKTTPIMAADSSDGDGTSSCFNAPSTTEILLSRHATNSKIVPAARSNNSNVDYDEQKSSLVQQKQGDEDSHHVVLEYLQPTQHSFMGHDGEP